MSGEETYFIVPGSLATPTGGYLYDREMVAALAAARRLAAVIGLPGAYPVPSPQAVAAAAGALAALPDGAPVVVDGLAFAPLLPVLRIHADRLRLVALVHHPLCDETGLAADRRVALFEAEKAALGLTVGIVATSAATARRLADFGVDGGRIAVVRPGAVNDRLPPRLRRPDRPPRLLAVGSLVPRKAQDELLRALAPLRRAPWRLTLIGAPRDPDFARRLRLLVRGLGLADRVSMPGAVATARLPRHYSAADLFVLPSRHEGFGIAFVEALAHGLPVVARRAGAVPEALPAAAAWLPEDAGAQTLTALLRPLLLRRPTRISAATRAQTAARRLRSWRTARREFLAALNRMISG
jgi:glycosyltransferase involved in cell wall biosynthesis